MHARLWGAGPSLLTLVRGSEDMSMRPRLSSFRDLPSYLRFESPFKTLPAQYSKENFRPAMLLARSWPHLRNSPGTKICKDGPSYYIQFTASLPCPSQDDHARTPFFCHQMHTTLVAIQLYTFWHLSTAA